MNNSSRNEIAEQLRQLLLEFHNFGGELYPSHVGVNQVARALKCSPSSVSGAFKKLGFENHAEYAGISSDEELLSMWLQRLASNNEGEFTSQTRYLSCPTPWGRLTVKKDSKAAAEFTMPKAIKATALDQSRSWSKTCRSIHQGQCLTRLNNLALRSPERTLPTRPSPQRLISIQEKRVLLQRACDWRSSVTRFAVR